jgi:predicted nucleic acid-binding protein
VILYLDASALIKLYVAESGSDAVRGAVDEAEVAATHLITYVEMHAALARLHGSGWLDDKALTALKRDFERDWATLLLITLPERIIRKAGDLAERFRLRGYDSVHLAAAESLLVLDIPVRFACFDRRLNAAAREIGLEIM